MKKLKKYFPDLPAEEYETLVDDVPCALQGSTVPQQGHMWITPNYITFLTKIVKKQSVIIKRESIVSVEKKNVGAGANVYPYGIDIKVKGGKRHSFSSFPNRDKTFDLIKKPKSDTDAPSPAVEKRDTAPPPTVENTTQSKTEEQSTQQQSTQETNQQPSQQQNTKEVEEELPPQQLHVPEEQQSKVNEEPIGSKQEEKPAQNEQPVSQPNQNTKEEQDKSVTDVKIESNPPVQEQQPSNEEANTQNTESNPPNPPSKEEEVESPLFLSAPDQSTPKIEPTRRCSSENTRSCC